MKPKKLVIGLIICMMVIVPTVASASSIPTRILFGIDDNPLGDRDNQDLVFWLSGTNLSLSSSTGAGSWQNLASYIIDNNGTPYMDNASYDGVNMNLLNFATGTGGFAGNPASPNVPQQFWQFWGANGGGASPYFVSLSGDLSATLTIEVSAWAASNTLSYVGLTDNIQHVIFTGSASAGSTTTITPGQSIALIATTPAGIFQSNTNNGAASIAPMRVEEAPELASLALAASGLAGLGFLRRRKQLAVSL